MEIIELLETFNSTIDKYYWVKATKFFLGFYLIVMLCAIILGLYRLWKIGYWTVLIAGQEMPAIGRGIMQKKWEKIGMRIESDNPTQWKIAVIEAAQLLDDLLKIIKIEGDSLGARLEGMNVNQLSNLEQAREAVKVRNRIVQDKSFQPSREEAQKVVEQLGESLRFFEAID